MPFKLSLNMRVHLLPKKDSFVDCYERIGFLLHAIRGFEAKQYTHNGENATIFKDVFCELVNELRYYNHMIDINYIYYQFTISNFYKSLTEYKERLLYLVNSDIKFRYTKEEFTNYFKQHCKIYYERGYVKLSFTGSYDPFMYCIAQNYDIELINSIFKRHYEYKFNYKIIRNISHINMFIYSVLLDSPHINVIIYKEEKDSVIVKIKDMTSEQIKLYRGDILSFIQEKLNTKDIFVDETEYKPDIYLEHIVKYTRIHVNEQEVRDVICINLSSGFKLIMNPD